ncbi:hypothetical protein [Candidatus Hodarchaeum mangrovi]
MTKRRYKSKWHRYGSLISVVLVALGGLFMILYGVIGLLKQTAPETYFLLNYISLSVEFMIFFSMVSIIAGIGILVVSVQQKPHEKKTATWMVIAAILGVLGGTIGGLIVFGGVLIYFILYLI